MRIHLITAESPESRQLRFRRLIQFPQLTMPLLGALTPPEHELYHTDEIVEAVDFGRPADLVAITTNTPSALHAYWLADRFRLQGIPVVLGGPHPTLLPREAKQYADAVVIGEAEDTWPRLLEDFPKGQLQPFYRSSGRCELAGMPSPRWDLIKRRHHIKGVTIATRGCPHRCDYCSIPLMYGPRLRFRPVEEVAAEVARIPGKSVVFWDDNLAANPAYARELFRRIAPFGKWWTTQATLQVGYDEEFLRLAAASGCQAIFVGLESMSQDSLDGTNKRHNRVKEYEDLLRRFHDYGIAVHAGIMFGLEGDGRDVFARTVEFADRVALDVATVSMVVPMPGTALFHRLWKEGRILTTDWSKYNGKKDCVFRPAHMTPEDLVMGTEWAARQFYSWRSITRRISASRCGWWWNLPRNLGYKLALDQFGPVGYDPAQPGSRDAYLARGGVPWVEPGPEEQYLGGLEFLQPESDEGEAPMPVGAGSRLAR